ncbi:ABC transporter ATP-binding protein [Shewanella sp. SNU WT4]|uniref:ATP-binding cassette domain-containing protein n=1 Tax=Shewanella sp. SNU WT4 TaxID=2590015 RepID=UPI00112CC80C|nr:ABC transporter ATP-binding protein [Shewanella sp. SNU WT4]QDF67061.1 ABC transporter ATP-binding protein [Shewanella sp. SNU WT4]
MALLTLNAVSIKYNRLLPPVLQAINLTIAKGQCHCVSGPTGSGKSSLLNLLAGAHDSPYEGEITRAPNLITGLVMQDPQTQLLRQTVGAEVAFALENLSIPSDQMLTKVQVALAQVGLKVSVNTPVNTLSLGQKYRLMLAAQLVCEPQLLLLDEPWAQLDDQGVCELLVVLQQLLQSGMALVLVEHNTTAFAEIIHHHWHLEAGKLWQGAYKNNEPEDITQPAFKDHQQQPTLIWDQVVSADGFDFAFDTHSCLFSCPKGFILRSGEIVSLVGANGSGKTSLLKSMAGMLNLQTDLPLTVLGQVPKLGIFGAQFGLLMQRPSRQLFETTVLAELQFSLKRFALPQERAMQWLTDLDLLSLAQRSPHTLSYGQQHLVALASLACLQPKVLLLDDPLAGMDKHYSAKVWYLLQRLSTEGCGILLTSHREINHKAISRQLNLRKGQLVAALKDEAITQEGNSYAL